MLFSGCSDNKKPENQNVDYSQYSFVVTYGDATKTITLNCIETTDEMVTTIKIVKCDENSLQLDFNGEIRIFENDQ